ncbi:MAG: hypothetical protein AAFY57_11820 [Cyanobacteria bacterium J06642_2]
MSAYAPPFTLHLDNGSVSFTLPETVARDLQNALQTLVIHLREAAQTKQPQATTEFRHAGDIFLEAFCNPNIWPTPFAAKLLLTIRDDRLRLSVEAELTQVLDDISQYLESL